MALGALRFVALDLEAPLLQGGLAIALEPLGGGSGGKSGRFQGGEEGRGDSDLDAADVEAIRAAAITRTLAGAMVPG